MTSSNVGTAPLRTRPTEPAAQRKPRDQKVPNEGDNGLFSQQWFPICLSRDVQGEKIYGTDFLDGRVIVTRDGTGKATVLSAYCAHLGVDLSLVEEQERQRIRCPFHHFEFDTTGACVATGVGERPPANARLFNFPTQEMYGIIFAFNGESPTYPLPKFSVPDDEVVFKSDVMDLVLPIDPWVVSANTPDLSHLKVLHGLDFVNDPYDGVEWTNHSFAVPIHACTPEGYLFDIRVGIHGTNYYFQQGQLEGRWHGWATPFGLPRPGQTKVFYSIATTPLADETPAETEGYLDFALGVELHLASQDVPVFQGIRFQPQALTRSDRVLAQFFEYVRRFPRAHPSASFMRCA